MKTLPTRSRPVVRDRAKRSHKTVLPVPAHTDFNFLSTWIDNEVGELLDEE